MKYRGHSKLSLPTERVLFKREEGVVEFLLTAVENYDEFNAIVERPKIPIKTDADGTTEQLVDHPLYRQRINEYSEAQGNWSFYQAFRNSPDLEFETVDPGDPRTWGNAEKELKAFLLPVEMMRIQTAWLGLNNLNEQRIQECRDDFLSGKLQAIPVLASSPLEGQENTPSEEPASDSTSSPQTQPDTGTTSQ